MLDDCVEIEVEMDGVVDKDGNETSWEDYINKLKEDHPEQYDIEGHYIGEEDECGKCECNA